MKAKKRKTPDARAREACPFLQADVTFLIAVGKRISKAKKIIFGFGLFCFVVTIYFYILPKLTW